MKAAVVAPLLLVSVVPSAADDFAERWNALNPPTVEIMNDAPEEHIITHHIRHARAEFGCHRHWFTRDHHRYWRCR